MPDLNRQTRRYLADSYPHNHTYRVIKGRVWPGWQLYKRARRLTPLYPKPLTSFLDLSVSKGYFAIEAALRPGQPRVLGIDVNPSETDAARAVSHHLGLESVHLQTLLLHELAEQIDAYGGPFQTALLINTYQYHYYGSLLESQHYDSHDEIFRALRAVCNGTLIFSNCVDFVRLQGNVKRRAHAQGRHEHYTPEIIREAAQPYFSIEERGRLGRRPLWRLSAI
jgi:hypothetical protein